MSMRVILLSFHCTSLWKIQCVCDIHTRCQTCRATFQVLGSHADSVGLGLSKHGRQYCQNMNYMMVWLKCRQLQMMEEWRQHRPTWWQNEMAHNGDHWSTWPGRGTPCLWYSLIQENNQVSPVGHFPDIRPDDPVYFLASKTMRWPL